MGFGLPQSIVSDRDRRFLSAFWQHLNRLNGTKLKTSTPYHPQTDGQSERANRVVEDMLFVRLRNLITTECSQAYRGLKHARCCFLHGRVLGCVFRRGFLVLWVFARRRLPCTQSRRLRLACVLGRRITWVCTPLPVLLPSCRRAGAEHRLPRSRAGPPQQPAAQQ
eukprot:357949-Chlamydomonas_euryale.AAC.1